MNYSTVCRFVALFDGIIGDIVGMAPAAFIFFLVYEPAKVRSARSRGGGGLGCVGVWGRMAGEC